MLSHVFFNDERGRPRLGLHYTGKLGYEETKSDQGNEEVSVSFCSVVN